LEPARTNWNLFGRRSLPKSVENSHNLFEFSKLFRRLLPDAFQLVLAGSNCNLVVIKPT
jgi:hypothetical protein